MPGKKYRFYGNAHFVVTIGKPNWYERKTIKNRIKAGIPTDTLFVRKFAVPKKAKKK